MANCPIVLKNLLAGEDPNGHFYLVEAPLGYDGTLRVSSGGPWSQFQVEVWPDTPSVVPGGYNAIVDLQEEVFGRYVFRYVTPATYEGNPTDPSDCDVCVSCEDVIITKVSSEDDKEEDVCTQDSSTYNLFDIAGVSKDEWVIDYAPGSPQSLGFDLVQGSSGYGNFKPIEIPTGVYVFIFTRVGDGECESCSFILTLNIFPPVDTGEPAVIGICL
jgi:hypothetical protein